MGFRIENLAKWRVIGLMMLLSSMLVACGTTATPEDEEISFEGAPQVILSSPVAGDTYREGVGVNILLRVDNAGSDVARVAIEVDGEIIGEVLTPNEAGAPSFTVENGWPASGVGSHTITAIAYRTDSSINGSAEVTINVVAGQNSVDSSTTSEESTASEDTDSDTTSSETMTDSMTDTTENASDEQAAPAATNPPLPTAVPTRTPGPTSPPATNTPNAPQVVVTTGANVRSGPGLVFDPPVGSLAAGATAEILAVNPAGTWFKIAYYNGDGWISGQTVTVEGDISGLPREAGPATPIPPTPVPPTNTPLPASNVDLIIDAANSSFVPTFVCNQSSQITITVVNRGTERSAGATILIEDIQPNGAVGSTTQTVVGPLNPNENTTATAALTVSTFIGEGHTFRATVDSNNAVAESNENNNRWEELYVLEPGGC